MKTSADTLGMAGRLRLVVGLDGVGKCVLREQYATALHRVMRLVPGDDPTEGVVYILNPAGGVAQGDTLEADIRVESGAHALVTMPGATKVYRMERAEATSRTGSGWLISASTSAWASVFSSTASSVTSAMWPPESRA